VFAAASRDVLPIHTACVQGDALMTCCYPNPHVANLCCNLIQPARSDLLPWLFKHGADVNARDEEGFTALMWLSDSLAPLQQVRQCIQLLVAAHADIQAKDKVGCWCCACTGSR